MPGLGKQAYMKINAMDAYAAGGGAKCDQFRDNLVGHVDPGGNIRPAGRLEPAQPVAG